MMATLLLTVDMVYVNIGNFPYGVYSLSLAGY